jgi:hypothetical protein
MRQVDSLSYYKVIEIRCSFINLYFMSCSALSRFRFLLLHIVRMLFRTVSDEDENDVPFSQLRLKSVENLPSD